MRKKNSFHLSYPKQPWFLQSTLLVFIARSNLQSTEDHNLLNYSNQPTGLCIFTHKYSSACPIKLDTNNNHLDRLSDPGSVDSEFAVDMHDTLETRPEDRNRSVSCCCSRLGHGRNHWSSIFRDIYSINCILEAGCSPFRPYPLTIYASLQH